MSLAQYGFSVRVAGMGLPSSLNQEVIGGPVEEPIALGREAAFGSDVNGRGTGHVSRPRSRGSRRFRSGSLEPRPSGENVEAHGLGQEQAHQLAFVRFLEELPEPLDARDPKLHEVPLGAAKGHFIPDDDAPPRHMSGGDHATPGDGEDILNLESEGLAVRRRHGWGCRPGRSRSGKRRRR